MATETEEPRSLTEEEVEEEGGPVKPFLDHLEDLRWVLIKTVAAVTVAMVVCLIAGNALVQVLKWPLERAKISFPADTQAATFRFGTNQLGTFLFPRNPQTGFPFGTNSTVTVLLEPKVIGDTQVLAWRIDPTAPVVTGHNLKMELNTFGPAGGFIVALQIAFYGGLVIAAPFIFYVVGAFVFPALKLKERKYVYRGLFFGFGLFSVGVLFCYFALMPVALAASVRYSEWLGFSATQWRAEEYMSFVCKFMLGMGLGFEMPVVLLTLVKIGVLNYSMLSKARRYMIVINLVLGALLTTPEVITQVLMAVPLQLLYEITVWIAWYWERKERKRQEALEAAEVQGGAVQ